MNAQFIENLSSKINEMYSSLPVGGMEKNLNALLQSAFTKLELVSREEFDIQAQVLSNTRAQLAELEQQLAELEARLDQQS